MSSELATTHTGKPYRVVARLKNNRLWTAITATFPDVRSQNDAARRLGTTPGDIGRLLNMTWWPKNSRTDEWSPLARTIATSLRDDPAYLFDGELYGRPGVPLTLELDAIPELLDAGLLALPESPEEHSERADAHARLSRVMESKLTSRERAVLYARFGLDDGHEQTLREIAAREGVCSQRIRQIEAKALRKLRHPAQRKMLDGELSVSA